MASKDDETPPTKRSARSDDILPAPDKRVRVLHLDRDAVFRACFARLAVDAVHVLDGETPLAEVAPHVVLIETADPGALGILPSVWARAPKVPILALSAVGDEFRLGAALAAGCAGYLLKRDPVNVVLDGVLAAARGESPTSPGIARALVATTQRMREGGARGFDALSPRERDVLLGICAGHATGEIAASLGLSSKTVDTCRGSIFQKTGIKSTIELFLASVRHGFPGVTLLDAA
jgi:DNA-binding NarL/FixJ family response regulator